MINDSFHRQGGHAAPAIDSFRARLSRRGPVIKPVRKGNSCVPHKQHRISEGAVGPNDARVGADFAQTIKRRNKQYRRAERTPAGIPARSPNNVQHHSGAEPPDEKARKAQRLAGMRNRASYGRLPGWSKRNALRERVSFDRKQ